MRSIIALALAFSAQAYACPSLTGNFTCTYQDGSRDTVSISQEMKDGITTYSYNGGLIQADNVARPIQDEEEIREATLRAWCDDATTLKAQMLGKYYNNGSYFGDLTINLFLSMEGANLKQVTDGNLKSANGDYPIQGQVVCTPN
jgi:hypothetical protein